MMNIEYTIEDRYEHTFLHFFVSLSIINDLTSYNLKF